MTNQPQLVMLCGIPTSGKSTYVQKHLLENELCDAYVVLSTDYYIESKALENNISYNESLDKFFSDAVRDMHSALKKAIKESKNIVWDQTNLTPRVRKQKASEVPDSYTKTVVWFDVPLEEAMIRNQQRPGKVVPGSVLKRMFHTFAPPTESEGFDQIIKGN